MLPVCQLKVSNVMFFAEPDENDRSYAKLCSSVFNGPLATNLEVIILDGILAYSSAQLSLIIY